MDKLSVETIMVLLTIAISIISYIGKKSIENLERKLSELSFTNKTQDSLLTQLITKFDNLQETLKHRKEQGNERLARIEKDAEKASANIRDLYEKLENCKIGHIQKQNAS